MVFPQRAGAALILLALACGVRAASLQARIDAAKPGEVLVVEAGDHRGPLVIDKPLTLAGAGWPRIDGGGSGHVIAIRGEGVTVRGCVIKGSGRNLSLDEAGLHVTASKAVIEDNRIEDALHGIYLKKVSGCRISNNVIIGKTSIPPAVPPSNSSIVVDRSEVCATTLNVNKRGNGIHLWNSEENVIEGNTITATRDGMYFSFTNRTAVRDNFIHDVRYGLHYMYSDNNTFENNTFTKNAAGAAIMYSKGLLVRGNRFSANHGFRAYGMLLNSVDATRLEKNAIVGNTVGFYMENCNANVLTGNRVTGNYIAVRLTASSGTNVFSRNVFEGNMHPAELAGQSDSNRWEMGGVGNRWGDAVVVDLDGDGIGDFPHREPDLLSDLRRPFPAAGLLSGSPLLEILRFAHGRAALPDVEGIEDPAPIASGFVHDRR